MSDGIKIDSNGETTIVDCFVAESDSLLMANENAKHWWNQAVKRQKEIKRLTTEHGIMRDALIDEWKRQDWGEEAIDELLEGLGLELELVSGTQK